MIFKKGHKPWNKGKIGVISEETKRKISKAMKGRKAWNKGKIGVISEETKRKMSEAQKGRKKSKT